LYRQYGRLEEDILENAYWRMAGWKRTDREIADWRMADWKRIDREKADW
jgi:hypothetical protein